MSDVQFIWVFSGTNGRFPAGVFLDLVVAERWILQHSLSGILTAYPLDRGVYDWAIKEGVFQPTKPHQLTPAFIAQFSSALLDHHHYETGQRLDT